MKWRSVSIGVILIVIFGVIAYDLIPALTSEGGDTISEVVRDMAWGIQTLPAFLMFIMSHFFWGRKGGRYFDKSWVLIPVLLVGTVLADIFWIDEMNPIFVGIVYFLLGHLIWPQDSDDRSPI